MAQMKNFSFGLYACLAIGIGLAQTSAAAGAPVGDAPPPAGPPSSWSGPYIGLAGGGAWGSSNQIDAGPLGSGPTTHGYGISGGLFGETAGYNFQFGPWVFGPDGDFSWINARGHANEIPPFTTSTVVGTEEDWLGTVRGRFGWTPSDPVLIYATAGIAIADIKASIDAVNSPGFTQARTRWGGTVGAGVEAMLARSWSVKAEYLYVQFTGAGYFSPPPAPGFNARSNVPVDNDIFRVTSIITSEATWITVTSRMIWPWIWRGIRPSAWRLRRATMIVAFSSRSSADAPKTPPPACMTWRSATNPSRPRHVSIWMACVGACGRHRSSE